MVQIRYFAPSPRLRSLVSSYYWCETDLPLLCDRMRAELGQVRFIVRGALSYCFDDGRDIDCPPALLSGPTATPVSTTATGPFACFGAGLMPAGWSALIGVDADTLADDAIELRSVELSSGSRLSSASAAASFGFAAIAVIAGPIGAG